MLRRPFVLAGVPLIVTLAALSSACDGPTSPGGRPLNSTFTLTGKVTSDVGSTFPVAFQQPIAGASVAATGPGADGQPTVVQAATGPDGRYFIVGLRESVVVRVASVGFYSATTAVFLDRDSVVDLRLESAAPVLLEDGDLTIAQPVTGSIGGGAPRCDPNWDQNSPCRSFGLVVLKQRLFELTLRSSDGNLELHVFNGSNRLLYAFHTSPIVERIELLPGRYEIRLMAYYTSNWFELGVR